MQKGFFQSIIKFYHKPTSPTEHFILSNSNQAVYLYLSKWPDWYGNSCIISGEEGTGKTYLSNLWQKQTNAIKINLFNMTKKELELILQQGTAFIIDDFEQYFSRKSLLQNLDTHDFNIEEMLIKIFDLCKHENKFLLFITQTSITDLKIKTLDLRSRLLSANIFSLELPDEISLKTYLIKLFSDNQLKIPVEVIKYISKHVKKSYKEIDIIANEIDNFSLEQKRNITIPLVRDVLNRRKIPT